MRGASPSLVAEGGNGRSLADQKAVGGDAERGVMVESSPPPPLVMGESEFGLQLFIIARCASVAS